MSPDLLFWTSCGLLGLATLALGAPRVLARIPADARTSVALSLLVPALLGAIALERGTLDSVDGRAGLPYALAIVGVTVFAALETLRAQAGRPFGAADLAVWLLLWIPFDLRWNYGLFPDGGRGAYEWTALCLNVVAVVGYGRLRELPGFDFRLAPRPRDLGIALAAWLGVLVACLPIGLWTGFCLYPGVNEPSALVAAVAGPAILLTIAIPEEIFFRGILQGGLERATGRPWLALTVASAAFGLMHWNNVDTAPTLRFQLIYLGLATAAGAIYGLAYRRSGSLLAPALCHTGVDLIWHLYFQR